MDIKNIIALSMVKGIGPSFIKRNILRVESDDDCASLVRECKPEQEVLLPDFLAESEKIIEMSETMGIDVVSILSSKYPPLLREISDPPSVLYMKGNKSLLSKIGIAIIGTRKSSGLGNKIAGRLGEYFSRDYVICNGLVEGIDENSICVNGKIVDNVIGVISGGLSYNETCSKKHIKLIDEVLTAGGLIVSEYPPLKKEDKISGSSASRIQAGLSQGLILVQSSVNGGSKYTIKAFAKLGRALGVIHYPESDGYNEESFGANRLIVSEGMGGIAKILGLKSPSKLNIGSIVVINGKMDYMEFCRNLKECQRQELSFNL